MLARVPAYRHVWRILLFFALTTGAISCRPSTYATIFAPVPGARFSTADTIHFRSELNSDHLLAGPLGPAAWSWTSDRDGLIGQGSRIDASLSIGEHLITLSVDYGRGIATDEITVFVDY